MSSQVYNNFKSGVMSSSVNLSGDDIYVVLVTSTYTINIDTHTTYSDITNQVSGTGYTTSGQALTSKEFSTDLTNDKGIFDAADSTWSSSTITARAAIIYKKGNTPALSPLICYVDFGSDKSSSSANFTIQWNSSGIINIT